MSKAFTREDDAGLDEPGSNAPRASTREARTRLGARLLGEALAHAVEQGDAKSAADIRRLLAGGVLGLPEDRDVATLGAQVTLRDSLGRERVAVLVTSDEVGHVPGAASARSPLGTAIVGLRAGDTAELDGPRGAEEWTVVSIAWPE